MGTQCQTSAACLGGFDSINSSLMKKQSFWTPLYGLGARGSYYNKASISFSFIHFIQTLSISLLIKHLSLFCVCPCVACLYYYCLLNFRSDHSDSFKRLDLEHVEDTTLYS